MLTLSAHSANELFVAACAAVLAHGKPVAPRGMSTVEVLGAHLCLTDPRRRFVDLPPVRLLNPAFAVAEAAWILSGSDEAWIYQYNQRLADYADDGRLMGAYGPRLRCWRGVVDQLDQVRDLLAREPESRRAAVMLFDPAKDFAGHKDVPCTLGYRFFLRDGQLHMHTTMRSQDLWLGFCYDIFTATVLQELLAGWLGAQVGAYHHHVDSLHLYEQNLEAAARLPDPVEPSPAMPALRIAWEHFDILLQQVISGVSIPSDSWAEFASVLASYRLWKTGDRAAARRVAAQTTGLLGQALDRWYDHLERRIGRAAHVAGR